MYIRSVPKGLQSCIVTVGNQTWLKSLWEKPCESGHKSVRLVVEFSGSPRTNQLMIETPPLDPATPRNGEAKPRGALTRNRHVPSDIYRPEGVRSGPSHGLAP